MTVYKVPKRNSIDIIYSQDKDERFNKFKYLTDKEYLKINIGETGKKLDKIKQLAKSIKSIETLKFIVSDLCDCLYVKESAIQDMENFLKHLDLLNKEK